MNLEDALTNAFGEPTSKQAEFYKAKTRYIGYGGARGGGKSHAVRAKATFLAYEYPGISMLIIRRSLTELRENHVNKLLQIYAAFPEKPKYNSDEKAFTYPNGSRLKLGYCDSEQDVLQFQGQEYDVIFLDEATQLTEFQYFCLNACVRGVNKFPKRLYLTCNPGGVGHGWVKRLFIDKKYQRSERPKDYTFIQARVWDNLPMLLADQGFVNAWKEYKRGHKAAKLTEPVVKDLMYESDYVRTLDSLPEIVREAWLHGNWEIFSGQYFSEFDEKVHVVEPFPIPLDWPRFVSIDYGLDRFAVLWFARNGERTYCYRNFEASNLSITDAARTFKEICSENGEDITQVVAPVDLWSRRQDTVKSVADTFAENGIYFIQAGKERVAGWLQVKEFLKHDEKNPPKLVFFKTCNWILKYLPLLQFDVNKPNDVMEKPHEYTHSPDALRYFCSRWQVKEQKQKKKEKVHFKCLEPEEEGYGEVNEEYLLGGY